MLSGKERNDCKCCFSDTLISYNNAWIWNSIFWAADCWGTSIFEFYFPGCVLSLFTGTVVRYRETCWTLLHETAGQDWKIFHMFGLDKLPTPTRSVIYSCLKLGWTVHQHQHRLSLPMLCRQTRCLPPAAELPQRRRCLSKALQSSRICVHQTLQCWELGVVEGCSLASKGCAKWD